LIEERAVEIYNRLRDEVRRDFERLVDEYLGRSNVDERVIASMVKAIVGKEIARLKAEVEELGRQGVDAELVRKLIDEVYSKLLNDIKQIIDQRIMHMLDAINEQSSSIKDVLDLVNELLKAETEFEEELAKLRGELRSMLSEERVEELLYRTLIRRGIIRKRHRKWVLPVVGLGVLAAIIAGFIINPIVTFVIIAIVIVILLRW
jgi:Glu-tRNA(Gln) amidotransferase subunit E-like FAD-binding protein